MSISASFERELSPGFGIRATGIYSRAFNPYRRINLLPAAVGLQHPDHPAGSGPRRRRRQRRRSGNVVHLLRVSDRLRGRAFELFTLTNDSIAPARSSPASRWRRPGGCRKGWQLNASFSATKRDIPFINGLDPTEQGSSVQLADFDPELGVQRRRQRPGSGRPKSPAATSSPIGCWSRPIIEYRSGEPWARQVQFRGGVTIPTQVLRVEEIGARRLPNRTLVNLRAQKSLRLGQEQAARAAGERLQPDELEHGDAARQTGRTVVPDADARTRRSRPSWSRGSWS